MEDQLGWQDNVLDAYLMEGVAIDDRIVVVGTPFEVRRVVYGKQPWAALFSPDGGVEHIGFTQAGSVVLALVRNEGEVELYGYSPKKGVNRVYQLHRGEIRYLPLEVRIKAIELGYKEPVSEVVRPEEPEPPLTHARATGDAQSREQYGMVGHGILMDRALGDMLVKGMKEGDPDLAGAVVRASDESENEHGFIR